MKLFTKLKKALKEFYNRSSYHQDVDTEWDKNTSEPQVSENPHKLKGIPLAERMKQIDAKYDPLIEQARNKNQDK
jgi:hypothetical protein